jgi:hypothetical protein
MAVAVRHPALREQQMSEAMQIEYTVESYNTDPDGRSQQSDICKVTATSPQAAALKALNEELFTIGDTTRLRARVSHLTTSGTNNITNLYSKV